MAIVSVGIDGDDTLWHNKVRVKRKERNKLNRLRFSAVSKQACPQKAAQVP